MKPETALKPAPPIALTPDHAARLQLAVQQRDLVHLQFEAADLRVANTVQAVALELGVNPAIYDLTIHQSEQGFEFRPK